jgi:DNA polymerase III sliding clamp (beta) subunit (PCNA family)
MIELTIQQNTLAAALNIVTRASKPNSLSAAFELVRLDTSPGRLTLSCFNGEFAACGSLPALCQELASACVNAATLREVVQAVSGEVTLRFGEAELRLECGPTKTSLRLNADPLPAINAVTQGDAVSLPGKIMRRLAGLALFASNDELRPALQAIHLSIFKDGQAKPVLQAQAADGFSFGRVRISVELPPELDARWSSGDSGQNRMVALLPVAFLRMLAAVVEADDLVQIQIYPKGGRASFRVTGEGRDYLLDSALLGDGFPESGVEEVLSKALAVSGAELTLNPSDLERAIRQVAAMGTKQMFLKVTKGQLRAASEDTQFGQTKNVLPAKTAGPDTQVWLNADYLTRIIKASSGELTIMLGKPNEAVLVQSGDLVALIMPLLCATDPFENETAIPISFEQVVPAAALAQANAD